MLDKVILDHEKSYLVYFENFIFCDFLAIFSKNCPKEKKSQKMKIF